MSPQTISVSATSSAPTIRWITIEGNIGSGKSTFMSFLKSLPWGDNVEFVPEPVDVWETIRDSTGKSMIELFYGDQARNAFSFQMMAYISRLSLMRESIRRVQARYPSPTPDKPILIISERCLETDANVFAKMLFDDGKIREVDYQIYRRWFDEFTRDLPVAEVVYVRTSPEVCSERIHRRLRKGEEGIPLEYLTRCHEYHESWISPRKNKVILDGNQERICETGIKMESYNDWLHQIGVTPALA